MSEQKHGGPAFPNTIKVIDEQFAELRGMTLRDYFAAQAMGDVMADWRASRDRDGSDFDTDAEAMAGDCYSMADAMLKARQA